MQIDVDFLPVGSANVAEKIIAQNDLHPDLGFEGAKQVLSKSWVGGSFDLLPSDRDGLVRTDQIGTNRSRRSGAATTRCEASTDTRRYR
jgi:hypothetical protein